jgi:hypothetical protein
MKIDYRSPWVATGWENIIVNTIDGNTIVLAPTPRNCASLAEIKAFAALIAAAPELLEALQDLLDYDGLTDRLDREDYAKARAAVEKATKC